MMPLTKGVDPDKKVRGTDWCVTEQRHSQDFGLGGATRPMPPGRFFRDLQKPTHIRWGRGGGVVADIFRDLLKRTRFAGGGG